MIIEYRNGGGLVGFRKQGEKKFYYRPAFESDLQRDDCFRDIQLAMLISGVELQEFVEVV